MATRSNIGVRETDGTTTLIYCHNDGYPSHNGRTLLTHHNSEAAAREIVKFGAMSFLDKRTSPNDGEAHSYMRDRGETGCEAQTLPAGESPLCEEYAYVWDVAADHWLWCGHGQKELVPLTPAAWEGDE